VVCGVMSHKPPCPGINSITDHEINELGIFEKIPKGEASSCIFIKIMKYLNLEEILNFRGTSIIKNIDMNDKIYEYVKNVIYKYLTNKYYKIKSNGTPFVIACEMGNINDVKLFIINHSIEISGIKLDDMVNQLGISCYEDNVTPLMEAINNNNYEVIKYLIDNCNIDTSITDDNGSIFLHCLPFYSFDKNVLKYLFDKTDYKSYINQMNNYLDTPLDCIYKSFEYKRIEECKKDLDLINFLRSYGAKVNNTKIRDIILFSNNLEFLEDKLKNINDINKINEDGLTILDEVRLNDKNPLNDKICTLLEKYGAKNMNEVMYDEYDNEFDDNGFDDLDENW
jgi:ankyrin repeat protein